MKCGENLNLSLDSTKQNLSKVSVVNYDESSDSTEVNSLKNCNNYEMDFILLHSVHDKYTVSKSKTNSYSNEVIKGNSINMKPLEIQRNIKTNQTMRLAQYKADDVMKLINKIREKYSSEQKCLFCNFVSKDLRAISVHMTKLHK